MHAISNPLFKREPQLLINIHGDDVLVPEVTTISMENEKERRKKPLFSKGLISNTKLGILYIDPIIVVSNWNPEKRIPP